jgi:hypothetical protein
MSPLFPCYQAALPYCYYQPRSYRQTGKINQIFAQGCHDGRQSTASLRRNGRVSGVAIADRRESTIRFRDTRVSGWPGRDGWREMYGSLGIPSETQATRPFVTGLGEGTRTKRHVRHRVPDKPSKLNTLGMMDMKTESIFTCCEQRIIDHDHAYAPPMQFPHADC